ncbi:quinone oxidoreductase family protein [Rothia nasisuis]|uniref:quinone oxidoreductase family protein n=1 Tax=Rothia nasisuis TaxID=2109647 RepID=UPI001F246C58|nr:quinone oxidoreductase [Rothia nasisuis]
MSTNTMKAVQILETGGPEVLVTHDIERPTPGPGQLLVETIASGVNFIETYQRSGIYPVELPFVPGAEATGRVVATGKGVEDFAPGDVIATASATGTYAEYFTAPAEFSIRVPEGVDPVEVAALPLQGMTAHYLINSTYPVQAGENVLFHAGAGGVGGIAVQLLKAKGATVIATVSSDEKEAIARAHGADYVLRYEGFADRVRDVTDGEGVAVVYDGVGKDTFEGSLRSLKVRGLCALFGGASGQIPPLDLQILNRLGSLSVCRPSLWHYLQTREEFIWRMNDLFKAMRTEALKLTVDQAFPLRQASEAHCYLEARKTRGKVLLIP